MLIIRTHWLCKFISYPSFNQDKRCCIGWYVLTFTALESYKCTSVLGYTSLGMHIGICLSSISADGLWSHQPRSWCMWWIFTFSVHSGRRVSKNLSMQRDNVNGYQVVRVDVWFVDTCCPPWYYPVHKGGAELLDDTDPCITSCFQQRRCWFSSTAKTNAETVMLMFGPSVRHKPINRSINDIAPCHILIRGLK